MWAGTDKPGKGEALRAAAGKVIASQKAEAGPKVARVEKLRRAALDDRLEVVEPAPAGLVKARVEVATKVLERANEAASPPGNSVGRRPDPSSERQTRPWEAEGISARTWYRRKGKAAE